MTDPKVESAADRAVREALQSVERLEHERAAHVHVDATDAEADSVELIDASDDLPPSGDAVKAPTPVKRSAADALLEATIKAKGELQEVLSQTQKEAKDMFDRLTRVSADFENYKKRVSREKDDAIKFGNEKILKELLPVLDNLVRALGVSTENSPLAQGVKLVAKQFEDGLGKFGVVGFDSLGRTFDPQKHEAVGSRADDTVPAQHVCEEFQRGYVLHERLLRPALVIVSAGPTN